MTREEFIREIIVALTQKRNLITDIIFDAQTIIKMADDFVAHREFKLNDDVELVAEKRYNEREGIRPPKNAKKYNYTAVWVDKTDEDKDKKEKNSTSDSDAVATEKIIQEMNASINWNFNDCEVDTEHGRKYEGPEYDVPESESDSAPASEFDMERQEGDPIDDYTTRQRPLNDKGFPENYNDITEKDLPEDREAFEKKAKIYGSFSMSPVEYLRLEQFHKDHHNCLVREDGMSRFGTIGGGTFVRFMGTGLGNIVHVKCEHCGTEVDLTDTDCW